MSASFTPGATRRRWLYRHSKVEPSARRRHVVRCQTASERDLTLTGDRARERPVEGGARATWLSLHVGVEQHVLAGKGAHALGDGCIANTQRLVGVRQEARDQLRGLVAVQLHAGETDLGADA